MFIRNYWLLLNNQHTKIKCSAFQILETLWNYLEWLHNLTLFRTSFKSESVNSTLYYKDNQKHVFNFVYIYFFSSECYKSCIVENKNFSTSEHFFISIIYL